ncbi:M16 family metallopeptidase [Kitasatospora sp. NPDC059827]|uniref:M16 family metallopeptidase n=1 Tax=Kitasatospora sp. NPDC059827 TaxID=3346964 RepID=UPI003647F3D3
MTPSTQTVRLDNGLRLVAAQAAHRPVTALDIAAGSRNDPPALLGLAHLVEHLMFPRGGPSQVLGSHTALIEAAGGTCGATTYRDHTSFHTMVPSREADTLYRQEASRLLHFAPTPEQLRTEVRVIAQEIREAGTGPLRLPVDRIRARLVDHGHNGFGDTTHLAHATLQQVHRFHSHHYGLEHTVVAIVGPDAPSRTLARAARRFAPLPARPGALSPDATTTAVPAHPASVLTQFPGPAPSPTVLAVGYLLPPPEPGRPECTAQLVLAEHLNRTVLPQLTRRTPGLLTARWTHGYYGEPFHTIEPDLAHCSMLLDPLGNPRGVTTALQSELHRIAYSGPGEPDLRRAAGALQLAHWQRKDAAAEHARMLSRYALLYDDADWLEHLPRAIQGITTEAVQHAARTLLHGPHAAEILNGGNLR